MFGKEKPSWNHLWFKMNACNEQSVLLIKHTHMQTGFWQCGCGISAQLQVSLEPRAMSKLMVRYRTMLLSDQPASLLLLPSWQRKQESQHHCSVKSASFSCINWRLQILQARARNVRFPWNNSLSPPPTPAPKPKQLPCHMFCKKHFSQKQHLLWNRTWQLSFNAMLKVRF